MATSYDWLDERQGRFTNIRHEADRVVVTLSPAHRRGAYFGVAISLAVVAGLSRNLWYSPPLSPSFILTLLASLAVAYVGAKALRRVLETDNTVLVIHDHNDARGDSAGAAISAAEIRAVEVRENVGRNPSDMAMWQTYIHLLGQDTATLLHQRPKWRYARERAIGEALSRRWRVPLIEPEAH
jgi:hypothetical protein